MEKHMTRIKSIGSLIDEMSVVRDRRRELAAEDKELEGQYKALEQELIAGFKAQGMAKGTGNSASASVSETVVANKLDWMEFMTWVGKTKNYHMVQQRVSDPAYREIRAKGKIIPGLEDFTKVSINLRNL
jgi:hypothetical protein